MELNDLLISLSTIIITYFVFRKFNFLIDDVNYSDHKKIGILNNSPIILGGIYLTVSVILLASDDYNYLKFLFYCIDFRYFIRQKLLTKSNYKINSANIYFIFFYIHSKSSN